MSRHLYFLNPFDVFFCYNSLSSSLQQLENSKVACCDLYFFLFCKLVSGVFREHNRCIFICGMWNKEIVMIDTLTLLLNAGMFVLMVISLYKKNRS